MLLSRVISRRSFLRRGSLYAGSLCAAFPAAKLAAQQPTQEPTDVATFSSSVRVVNVLATVREKGGKAVSDLTKEDFGILEDNRPQMIQYFSQQSALPLTLGLLMDTSLSELGSIDAQRKASHRFFDRVLREDQDKAYVMHFDTRVVLRQKLTSSKSELHTALDQVGRDGLDRGGRGSAIGTLLWDAVAGSCVQIMAGQEGRKAIILFTDGQDYGSKNTLDQAIAAAERADVLVYSIRFADDTGGGGFAMPMGRGGRGGGGGFGGGGRGGGSDGIQEMKLLSEKTGGAYFEAGSTGTLDKVYARIEDELRNQYNLGYTSDQGTRGFHALKVTTNRKNLVVQARQGYYAR